jgi:hypothetical protein
MKRYAILVANSEFPNYPALQTLETPLNDIRGLGDALEHKSRGNFSVKFVENGTADVIGTAIQDTLNLATREDLVLIYYSGHGILDRNSNLSFATHDSQPRALLKTLQYAQVATMVADSLPRRVVVILDLKPVRLPPKFALVG